MLMMLMNILKTLLHALSSAQGALATYNLENGMQINPRRACTARVIVLGLSFCPSVRLPCFPPDA